MNLRTNLSQLPERAFTDGRVSFREIRSEDDLAWATCELQLTPDQQDLVNPAGFSIGRAYLFPEDNIPYLICLEGQEDPIGFILLRFTHWVDDPNCWCYYSKCEPRTNWSYFIDSRYQGQGYGRAAASWLSAFCGRPPRNLTLR